MRLIDADGIDDETIDAIPVEWLERKRKECTPKSVNEIDRAFACICIDSVLEAWKNEKED